MCDHGQLRVGNGCGRAEEVHIAALALCTDHAETLTSQNVRFGYRDMLLPILQGSLHFFIFTSLMEKQGTVQTVQMYSLSQDTSFLGVGLFKRGRGMGGSFCVETYRPKWLKSIMKNNLYLVSLLGLSLKINK